MVLIMGIDCVIYARMQRYIGDEFYYILQCKSSTNERKLYPSQYFSHRINTLKFGQLFQIKNKPKLTKLCKFIRVLQYHASPPG